MAPKIERNTNALSFLENPKFADVPLVEMQDGLRKILGYTTYSKLSIAKLSGKDALITTFKNNVAAFQTKLDEATKKYETALQNAIAKNQERYREHDERIRTTLKCIKNSGLGLCDLEYLTSQLKAGYIMPDIGVPFDKNNIDLANGNF